MSNVAKLRQLNQTAWELVDSGPANTTERLAVTGGWLYRTSFTLGCSNCGPVATVAMAFVADPTAHMTWTVGAAQAIAAGGALATGWYIAGTGGVSYVDPVTAATVTIPAGQTFFVPPPGTTSTNAATVYPVTLTPAAS